MPPDSNLRGLWSGASLVIRDSQAIRLASQQVRYHFTKSEFAISLTGALKTQPNKHTLAERRGMNSDWRTLQPRTVTRVYSQMLNLLCIVSLTKGMLVFPIIIAKVLFTQLLCFFSVPPATIHSLADHAVRFENHISWVLDRGGGDRRKGRGLVGAKSGGGRINSRWKFYCSS